MTLIRPIPAERVGSPLKDAAPSPVGEARVWLRLRNVRAFALVGATLFGVYICFLLALPFLAALIWALTIAVLAAPLHRQVERGLQRPSLAAGLSVGVLAVLVMLPLTVILQQLLVEVGSGATAVQKQFTNGDVQRNLTSLPVVGWLIGLLEGQFDLKAMLATAATWLTNVGGYMVTGSLASLITLLLTFYFLFFFLRDREDALRQLKWLSPLAEPETEHLLERLSDTIRAMVFGTIVTAALQGALGGLMFWLLGLPNPVFWGLVMMVLAMVPVLGTFVIWIPTAAYLALIGEWGKALVLTAWGGILIAGIDNLLYPILTGRRLRMPTVPMFIAIVGGLMMFGASGLILGPLLVTATLTLLEIWRRRAETPPSA